jgi:AcrR family transcriptional regulator
MSIRQQRRERILHAAAVLMRTRGTTITMDEIAEEAGVGRRTLFRYFPTREDLLVAAVEHSYRGLAGGQFQPPAGEHPDPFALLDQVLHLGHRQSANAGRGLWQIVSNPEVGSELAKAAAVRRTARRIYTERFTDTLWTLAGGPGHPPRWLIDAFSLLESMFTYYHQVLDLEQGAEESGTLAARLMAAALRDALVEAGIGVCRESCADDSDRPVLTGDR